MKAYSQDRPCRIAIMLSGRGSNFLALQRDSLRPDAPYRLELVFSDQEEAPGLAHARRLGLPTHTANPRQFPGKAAYERSLVALFREQRIDLVCLAGYMRIVGAELLAAFPQRLLNIHPALLPSFPGLHAQRQALEYGVRISGCTVHLVDAGTDSGPIVAQAAVPVLDGDTEETLSIRILEQEHLLYPQALRRICRGDWRVEDRRVLPDRAT